MTDDFSYHLAGIEAELNRVTAAAAERDYAKASALCASLVDRMNKARLCLMKLEMEQDMERRLMEVRQMVGLGQSSTAVSAKLVTS